MTDNDRIRAALVAAAASGDTTNRDKYLSAREEILKKGGRV